MNTEQQHSVRGSVRLTYNSTALAAGAILIPATRQVLHVAGDQYGVGLALLAAAAVLDRRLRHWLTRTLVCTVALGCVADHHALMQTLAYLLGAVQ